MLAQRQFTQMLNSHTLYVAVTALRLETINACSKNVKIERLANKWTVAT